MEQTIEKRNTEEAQSILDKTVSIVDKAASKGIIHKNKAARHVSQIRRKVNSLVGASPNP